MATREFDRFKRPVANLAVHEFQIGQQQVNLMINLRAKVYGLRIKMVIDKLVLLRFSINLMMVLILDGCLETFNLILGFGKLSKVRIR